MSHRIAFLFPGQAAHRPGMLSAWMPERAGLLQRLARATGLDLVSLGDDEQACSKTAVGQPAIFSASLAALDAVTAAGVVPDVVAGHSLGEVTASVAAGALTPEAGARLVLARGRAMGRACRATPGTMAAVVRIPGHEVDELVRGIPDVVVANRNGPEQTVVSGSAAGIDQLTELVTDRRGRVLGLDVEGAFHSPAMAPAVAAMRAELSRTEIRDPAVPLLSGVDAESVVDRRGLVCRLTDGILAPVQWVAVQRRLVEDGVTLAVELGPGGLLTGMARRAVPDLDVHVVQRPEDVASLRDVVEGVGAAR